METLTNNIRKSLITLISVALVIRTAGNIFQPALSYLASDLGVSKVEATTNLTLYYFCLTLSFLVFGPICDRYSKNRLLQVSLVGCFLGCILCGAASDIVVFNIGRCVQAFSAGLALLSSQIWIGDQPEKKAMIKRLAWFSMVVSIAPILAPVIGGFISDWLSWRYSFWFILILCVIGLLVTIVSPLPDTLKDKSQSDISTKDVLKNYWKALCAIPVIQMSLSVLVLYMGQSMFATISSFLFIDAFGITASQLGIVSGIMVFFMVIGRFPTLYLCGRYSVRTVFLICESLVLLSSLYAICFYFIHGAHTMLEVIVIVSFQMLGFSGLSIIITNNIMLVGGDQKGTVSGLYNFSNQACAWIGVLAAQFLYHLGLNSVTIFQYMAILVFVVSIVAVILFLRTYSQYRKQLEI